MNTIILQAADGAQGGGIMSFLPLILIGLVFYFFMIRPQIKRTKELKAFRESLQKGDKIMTTGGIIGKVLEINDDSILITSEGTKLRMDKSAVIMDVKDALINQKK
jgi:preprotein translocase subunit YajC